MCIYICIYRLYIYINCLYLWNEEIIWKLQGREGRPPGWLDGTSAMSCPSSFDLPCWWGGQGSLLEWRRHPLSRISYPHDPKPTWRAGQAPSLGLPPEGRRHYGCVHPSTCELTGAWHIRKCACKAACGVGRREGWEEQGEEGRLSPRHHTAVLNSEESGIPNWNLAARSTWRSIGLSGGRGIFCLRICWLHLKL